MATPYFYWKIRTAVATLAREDEPLKQRLLWALSELFSVREDQIPPDVLPFWLELNAQTTWRQDGDPGDGAWQRTLDAMSDIDARKAAELLVHVLVVTSRHVDFKDLRLD